MTTALQAITALSAMSVTGVTRVYAYPPTSLNNADLPAMWVQLPTMDSGRPLVLSAASGWPRLTVDVIIAVEPVGTGTQAANFAAQVTLLDALDAALAATDIGKARPDWRITAGGVTIAGNDFWALRAEVNIHG